MAVEFAIGVQSESKRADPKGFENTEAACGPHALPILVSLASESRMIIVAGALRRMGILLMIIMCIGRALGSPSLNPVSNSLHGSNLLSKCSNLGLQRSLLGSFWVMATGITEVFNRKCTKTLSKVPCLVALTVYLTLHLLLVAQSM